MSTETETVELTHAMLQGVLNMTSSPEHWTDRTRALVVAVHKAQWVGVGSRWRVPLTREEVRALHYVLRVYTLRRPSLRVRFDNWLCQRSDLYRETHEEFINDGRKAS